MSEPPLPHGLVRPSLSAVEPYEPGRPISAVRLESGIQEVVKLASNEGPFPPFPAAQQAISESISQLRMYPDPGAWILRDAISQHARVPVDLVQPGNGVDSLIKLLCMTVLDPGDEMVMGWPSFPSWRQGALIMGASPVLVPLTADGAYDLDGLLAAITPRTKMVVVVSPNNPTGAAVDAAALTAFLDRVPGHVLPVLDEAYYEYMGGTGHNGAKEMRNGRPMVVTRTFSKIFGLAGLRVGYMFAPTALISEIGKVRNVFDVNTLAKTAATASLAHASQYLPDRVALNAGERTRVSARLTALGTPPLPSDGNFVYVDMGDGVRAGAIVDALLARGIIIRPTRAFGAPTGVRVTIGLPAENDRFLSEYAVALAELPAPS
ncbi:MAG TPA: aminotransferase class I/II-fold pyridoxal phosphate-dependent enzyme [Miltoncostaeales bacterium]|nr:aminotransferase class I/II-fold pyridoxal phosphate-dependent enzyme [Miltoncostaeales bacterium]